MMIKCLINEEIQQILIGSHRIQCHNKVKIDKTKKVSLKTYNYSERF